jgi:hypothetical protein
MGSIPLLMLAVARQERRNQEQGEDEPGVWRVVRRAVGPAVADVSWSRRVRNEDGIIETATEGWQSGRMHRS